MAPLFRRGIPRWKCYLISPGNDISSEEDYLLSNGVHPSEEEEEGEEGEEEEEEYDGAQDGFDK